MTTYKKQKSVLSVILFYTFVIKYIVHNKQKIFTHLQREVSTEQYNVSI